MSEMRLQFPIEGEKEIKYRVQLPKQPPGFLWHKWFGAWGFKIVQRERYYYGHSVNQQTEIRCHDGHLLLTVLV